MALTWRTWLLYQVIYWTIHFHNEEQIVWANQETMEILQPAKITFFLRWKVKDLEPYQLV